jgi:hypothetical protein
MTDDEERPSRPENYFGGIAAAREVVDADTGEPVPLDELLNLIRQRVRVIDLGPSAAQRKRFSQPWSFPYDELCKWAALCWQSNKDRGDDMDESSGIERWAHDGFTTLEAHSDTYAAALMCTTAESVGFNDVHFPSPGIVFRIPIGLVDAEYARLDIARLGEVGLHVCGGSRHRTMFMLSDTIDDLLFTPLDESEVPQVDDEEQLEADDLGAKVSMPSSEPEPKDKDERDRGGALPPEGSMRNATKEEQRMFIMIRHYVAGMLVAYQTKSNWKYEGLRLSQAKRVRGVPPEHRYTVLGKEVRADVREGVRRYVNGTHHKSPAFQFVVRGHYRNQACGPKQSLRRMQWIEPYWKPGKDADAPILARSVFL